MAAVKGSSRHQPKADTTKKLPLREGGASNANAPHNFPWCFTAISDAGRSGLYNAVTHKMRTTLQICMLQIHFKNRSI